MHGRKLISVLSIIFIIAISIALLIWTTAVSATSHAAEGDVNEAGATVEITADNAANIHAAGARVNIGGIARDDVRAAGAIVNIDVESGGNLHVAGSQVNINGKVTGEAWLAGAEVKIDAVTGKALKAAGAWIEVVESSEVGAESSLAAALIEFRGAAGNNLKLYGDEVVFSGQASGDVTIKGRTVSVAEDASVQGGLTIQSVEKADIAPAATIAGDITQTALTKEDFDKGEGAFDGIGGALVFAIGVFLFGLILVVLARSSVEQGISVLRSHPGKSILWGLFVFIGLPLLAIISLVTVVGIPIGVTVLLTLPFLFLLGFTATAFGLSDWLLNRSGEPKTMGPRLLLLAVGVIVVIVLGFVPVVGGLIIIFALLFGLGAAVVTIGQRFSNKYTELPV